MNTRHYYLRLLRTFALATLTAAAVAACSDDTDTDREPLTPPDGADGIPVTFTANINPGSDAAPAGAPDTRTILTPDGGGFTVTWKGRNDNPDDYDKISIWADNKQGTLIGGMGKVYVPTTSNVSSELEPWKESEKFTLPSAGNWTFTAVYTATTVENSAGCTLSYQEQSEPGDTKHIARYDLSVATATQDIAADSDMPANINFTFHHLLSALQLHVTNETGAALTVKEIRLSADGGEITTQKFYDVAQGNWKTTGELKAAYLQLTAYNFPALATGGASQDLYMLLFPGYENETLTITVVTDRGDYILTKGAPTGGFIAGKNYLTNITLRTSGLTDKEKWVEYISNKAELIAFRNKVNGGDNYQGKTIYLADNIILTGTWTPIGTDVSKSFRGTFDGRGYHISGLNVDNGTASYAGLFGYVVSGKVRNLRVSGTVTTTGNNAGGIAGLLDGSTVENCIFSGTVKGRLRIGGIAGTNGSSRIAGCHTKGSVTATATGAGGIAGLNTISSTIDDCYSEAEVTAGAQTGGIAGDNTNGTIIRCYAKGKVGGSINVGGIVGYNNSTVENCIALTPGLTRTEGSDTRFGRIVGINDNNGVTVTSCAAYDGMTIKDVNTTDFYADATGEHGTALPAADCLTPAAYTSRDFPEATATTPGWAFDATTPWQYLPWNKIFDSWNISETEYRIAVPDYLKAPVIN